jgi:hypothetical protein
MHLFNKALLDRHAWRLIQKPDSLCAKVLKAKYFPHGNIIDTVFSSDPSPVWKGVEFGLELLKMGIINRIGDGKDTQIMRDQWLPRASGLKITALKKNSRKRWVNQLIIEGDRRWNEPLLRELFLDHDVNTILCIQLPAHSVSDRVAWHYETNGVFSVRSAYKLALQLKHQNRDSDSNSANADGNRPLWNCIWKAHVPPKVRVFAWKLATNSLPTKANKFRRKLEVCAKCDICGMESEDAYHAVARCTKAVGLRHALRDHWKLPPEHTFRYTGNDWLLILLNQLDDSSRSRVLLLFWRAWHLRNNVIYENGKEPISKSVKFLLSYATALPMKTWRCLLTSKVKLCFLARRIAFERFLLALARPGRLHLWVGSS